MSRQLLVVGLLAFFLGGCSKPPPVDPYANRRTSPTPIGASSPTATAAGLGSESGSGSREDYGTFRVKEETWLAVRIHDTRTMTRTRSPEEEKEFERLVEKGTIRRLPVGTIVKKLNDKVQIIDGNRFELMRVELVDEPDVHGNILTSSVEPMK